MLQLLPAFWDKHESNRFQHVALFRDHVVEQATRRYRTQGVLCRDPEEWANYVFSSAMIVAAMRRAGGYDGCPMAHFLWAIGRAVRYGEKLHPKAKIKDGATPNLTLLRDHLRLAFHVSLEELLGVEEADEHEQRLPSESPAPPPISPSVDSRAATPAPAIAKLPEGAPAPRHRFDAERAQKQVLQAKYEKLEPEDRAELDRRSEQAAREELAPGVSAVRLGLRKIDKRNELLLEIFPELALAIAKASA